MHVILWFASHLSTSWRSTASMYSATVGRVINPKHFYKLPLFQEVVSACVAFFLQVTVTRASLARPTHLLPMEHCKDFNTMTGRMSALIAILLWQAELVIVVLFSSLLSFLCEVALAKVAKMNTGEKTGLSCVAVDAKQSPFPSCWWVTFWWNLFLSNAGDISSCHKDRVIKGIVMPYLHTVCMGVVTRWGLFCISLHVSINTVCVLYGKYWLPGERVQ